MAYMMDEALMAEMEREISEFDEWNNRLQEELGYLLNQPATDENLGKIGNLVDYYFCDGNFSHTDHDIRIERLDDGGISITVQMDYENPEDYFIDFEVDHGVTFAIRVDPDSAMIDDMEPAVENLMLEFEVNWDYDDWKADDIKTAEDAFQRACEVTDRAERTITQRKQDIEDQKALASHVEMEKTMMAYMQDWHALMAARVASMSDEGTTDASDTAETATPVSKSTESPEDILFAPIKVDADKTPEAVQDSYDCG